MDMREAFEKAASSMALDPLFDYKKQRYYSQRTQGAWEVWQHLYPEIERAWKEGHDAGVALYDDPHEQETEQAWQDSTTKARLEGE